MTVNDEFENENPSELEEILYSMNTEEFLENELEDQLGESIFSEKKTNYLESYMSKYKFYLDEYSANEEFIESLKEKKDDMIEHILNEISDKFEFNIDDESRKTKVAKVLYEFFVIDYKNNMVDMILTYINDNKKSILQEIKRQKKGKDVSSSALKMKYNNSNDATIINNVYNIIFNIIADTLGEDFLELIIDSDDSVSNLAMKDFLENNKITVDDDTFKAFMRPLLDEEDGWSDVLSDVIMELTKNANKADLDIFEE